MSLTISVDPFRTKTWIEWQEYICISIFLLVKIFLKLQIADCCCCGVNLVSFVRPLQAEICSRHEFWWRQVDLSRNSWYLNLIFVWRRRRRRGAGELLPDCPWSDNLLSGLPGHLQVRLTPLTAATAVGPCLLQPEPTSCWLLLSTYHPHIYHQPWTQTQLYTDIIYIIVILL